MSIEIKNLKGGFPCGETNIRVDRASVLGNPYRLSNESERNSVCEKYKMYFKSRMTENPLFKAEVDRLVNLYKQHGKLNLYCWCVPKRCHAETIRDYILDVIQFHNC